MVFEICIFEKEVIDTISLLYPLIFPKTKGKDLFYTFLFQKSTAPPSTMTIIERLKRKRQALLNRQCKNPEFNGNIVT